MIPVKLELEVGGYSNTTLVSINPKHSEAMKAVLFNSNTTLVSINLLLLLPRLSFQSHSNTTLVSINLFMSNAYLSHD